jgi:hypothetical protein
MLDAQYHHSHLRNELKHGCGSLLLMLTFDLLLKQAASILMLCVMCYQC